MYKSTHIKQHKQTQIYLYAVQVYTLLLSCNAFAIHTLIFRIIPITHLIASTSNLPSKSQIHVHEAALNASWRNWLVIEPPIWRIFVKMGSSSPKYGWNIKKSWKKHHLVRILGCLQPISSEKKLVKLDHSPQVEWLYFRFHRLHRCFRFRDHFRHHRLGGDLRLDLHRWRWRTFRLGRLGHHFSLGQWAWAWGWDGLINKTILE